MPQNKKSSKQQVNIADKAARKPRTSPRGGKRTQSKKTRTVIISILVGVIVLMLAFLIVGGIMVYQAAFSPKKKVAAIDDMTSHIKTPAGYRDKMAYYILGLLGEEPDNPTEMLSILCIDKQKRTINILQVPQDTYLGDSDRWAVRRAADVFGNPKPLDWCISCRKPVEKSEIKDGKHTVCNATITQKEGSSSQDLCGVFNHVLGLPVDGYFLFPQQGLVKLVNLLGGVDVELESAISVNDIDYKKGVQTLDGDAALYYALNRKSGITGDIDRMVRQRKVFLALFQRLARQSKDNLTNNLIVPLMNGSTPIRSDFDRLEIVELLTEIKDIKPSSMTAYILPGRTGKAGGKTYYAAHKTSLLQLLNGSFNPYGDKITEAAMPALQELGSGAAMDLRKQVLSEISVEQDGAAPTTTQSTTKKA